MGERIDGDGWDSLLGPAEWDERQHILNRVSQWQDMALLTLANIEDCRDKGWDYFDRFAAETIDGRDACRRREEALAQFYEATQDLVGRIDSHHPTLDSCLLLRVYDAVRIFHDERSAASLPATDQLRRIFDAASIVVRAIFQATSKQARDAGGRPGTDPPPEGFEKVPSIRAVEQACGLPHDDMEKTARKLQDLGIIGPYDPRRDGRGRKTLWVQWLNKPEGLGRRTRRKKGPQS
jgi:hypothetical protein